MSPVCCAFAYATELSLSTFSATAALIGAATFALISDIAARSGSSSPAIAFSSSRDSCLYSCCSPISSSFAACLVGLVVVRVLDRVRLRGRVVREHVRRDRRVDRDGEVRVHERHRRPLRELLARELVQLLVRDRPVLLLGHLVSPSSPRRRLSGDRSCRPAAAAPERERAAAA